MTAMFVEKVGQRREVRMNDNILQLLDVASRLGKPPRTISRYCERGIFPNAVKDGPYRNSSWLIPLSDVEKYEQQYGRTQLAASQ